MKRIWIMSLIITTIIILDQLTKGAIQENFSLGESLPIIGGFFNFTYIQNTGAAFGFLAKASDSIRRPLFLYLPVLACFWLVYLIWKSRKGPLLPCLSYSLIFAGAVGNLIDRFSIGYVVDFLDFYIGQHHYPAFNIADSSITIAAILLLVDSFLEFRNQKKESATGRDL